MVRVVKECKDYLGYIVVKLLDNNCVWWWYNSLWPLCFETREEAERKFKELCEFVKKPGYEYEVIMFTEWPI